MTNNELLDAVYAWLGTLSDGYTKRKGTYLITDIENNLPLMLLRDAGNGRIDSNIKEKIVRVSIVCDLTQWPTVDTALGNIAAKARDNTEAPPTGTIKLRLLQDVKGPFEMEDGNKMLYLDLMVTL